MSVQSFIQGALSNTNFLFSSFPLSIQWISILSIYYMPGMGDTKINKMFPFDTQTLRDLMVRKYRQTHYSLTGQWVMCDIWGRKRKVLIERLHKKVTWSRPWRKSSYSIGRGSIGNFRWKINRSNTSKYRRASCVWGDMSRFAWLRNIVSEGVENGEK